mmetsp:Transcript_44427/g.104178  ORF Transcript_44427/g.104178 Transcript_44427/m.104178 type:complete len:101 (-) Transcript_44427:23-325(-)
MARVTIGSPDSAMWSITRATSSGGSSESSPSPGEPLSARLLTVRLLLARRGRLAMLCGCELAARLKLLDPTTIAEFGRRTERGGGGDGFGKGLIPPRRGD